MLKIRIFFVFFLLISCDSQVKNVNIVEPKVLNKVFGKYAVFIDKEGWDLKKNYNFFRCQKEKFNISINSLYQKKIIKILNQIFDNLTFYDYKISKETLLLENYLGVIEIFQDNAYSEFKFNGDYSEFRLYLNGLIKVRSSRNITFKSDISAEGFGRKNVLIDCQPNQVAKIAVENSISQYLKVISENIYKGIDTIKKKNWN